MNCLIIASLVVVASAAPQYGYQPPAPTSRPLQTTYDLPGAASSRREIFDSVEQVVILRDDRVFEEDSYNFDVETENGIKMSQSGSADGPDGSVVKAGEYSYTAPDGTLIEVRFVADENGFQPQGAHLPVAPDFPHPIPQFVLDQIAFAAEEDAAAARQGSASSRSDAAAPAPSQYYGGPQ